MEGFQLIGMHLCGRHRLGSVGMLWIGRLIPRPFGTSLMPLCPLILQPYFDALGPRLPWSSSCASAQGLTPQLNQETPLPPFAIGQERQIAGGLDDLAQKTHGFSKHLAVFPATMPVPQQTGRPLHQHHRPSVGRVRADLLMHAGVQLIPCNELWQKLMRQSEQAECFFQPLRRSGQR